MQTHETLNAFYRRADKEARISIRYFDLTEDDFQLSILPALKKWKPQGAVVRLMNLKHMEILRKQFPLIPFVSTILSPPELVNSCVVSDIDEVFKVACDYLVSRGLRNLALYCPAASYASPGRVRAFRAVAPGGSELVYKSNPDKWEEMSLRWLKELPKPVGVMTAETAMAKYVVERSQTLKLRVPEDVQVIGVDDADECLACDPHLTSVALPSDRIGEMALETILRYLQHEQPAPPPIVAVRGSALIPRGSTTLLRANKMIPANTLRLMSSQAREKGGVQDLAKFSRMALTTFYKQFSKTVGGTPGKHLRQLRIQEASKMLRETTVPISKIAETCGFTSIFSFSRCFRRETGQTPSAYRRKPDKRSGTRNPA